MHTKKYNKLTNTPLDNLQPWAMWFIRKRLSFMVYVIYFITIPLLFVAAIFAAGITCIQYISRLRESIKYHKNVYDNKVIDAWVQSAGTTKGGS